MVDSEDVDGDTADCSVRRGSGAPERVDFVRYLTTALCDVVAQIPFRRDDLTAQEAEY